MQFEINREDLLKLKQTNYDLYQLIMSQKSLDGDYCDWLDKEKLAKECELKYWIIEELFPKEQIIEAYKNIMYERISGMIDVDVDVKPAEEEGAYKVSVSLPEFYGHRTIEQEIKMIDSAIISGSQKKHAKLLEEIDECDVCVVIETEDNLEHLRFQGELVELGFKWRDGSKFESRYEKYLVLNLMNEEQRVICHTSTCVFPRKMLRKYDLKTEQFIN